jgi:patatin-related protein
MPDQEFEQEVRFAVVIYGGVSLAVYINGVVQEMLRLVRATAIPEARLKHSEKVYRKLAQIAGFSASAGTGDKRPMIHGDVDSDGLAQPGGETLRTKFVIDILSGTSAGGINAIYLAKALANNQPLLQLALMWINVADISKLLNDKRSAEPPVHPQVPPKSLLNSRWMYLKLLEALDGMEGADGDSTSLVEDLDLFSTATDIDGVVLPIALADKQVLELRHRNVFHFRKRGSAQEDRNDFGPDNNPFLAYAARCTSAFPFAFEPMALCDIFEVFPHLETYRRKPYNKETTDYWQQFYLEYIRDADAGADTEFRFRSFGDGGYLDNKPFSYAIDVIMARHADIPVDRKLIYVEPSPEDVGKTTRKRQGSEDRPDAVENSLAALIDLPRYETIREDLDRVLAWNRNVARIRRVMGDATARWRDMDVAAYKRGPAYRFYVRLRLSAVTDRVASGVTETLNFDPNSARGDAIRGLAGSWRTRHITSEAQELDFLAAYDSEYLGRAVRFLLRYLPARSLSADQIKSLSDAKAELHRLTEKPLPSVQSPEELARQAEQRRKDLEFAVNPQFAAELRKSDPTIPEEALADTDAGFQARLAHLLGPGQWEPAITAADQELRKHFAGLSAIHERLTPLMSLTGGWDRFDLHDSLVFPLVFGTNLGELDPIDIVRISPADVAALDGVDDGLDPSDRGLKGQKFGAFGGFFDRRWRLHDMLRGRLHAAERLITAVLSSAEPRSVRIREALIKEAQSAIALDWQETFESFLEQENA